MTEKERLMTLKTCLRGSRRKIYEHVSKAMKSVLDTPGGPQKIYDEVKRRHYRFLETSTERQLRVRGEWNALEKTKGMSCWQFEAEWERIHSELEEVGLGVGSREKMLAYICKVGPVSETIRLDRRPMTIVDGISAQ